MAFQNSALKLDNSALKLKTIKFHDTVSGSTLNVASFKNSSFRLAFTDNCDQTVADLLNLAHEEIVKNPGKKKIMEPKSIDLKSNNTNSVIKNVLDVGKAIEGIQVKTTVSSIKASTEEELAKHWRPPKPAYEELEEDAMEKKSGSLKMQMSKE